MQIKDFIENYKFKTDANPSASEALFRNEVTGEVCFQSDRASDKPGFMISCESNENKLHAELGNIVPREMRAVTQNHSSTSSSGSGVRVFNDADIIEYNEWAEKDGKCPVIRVVRKEPAYLLFVLRNPIHWKRVKANTNHESDRLFDVVFDGPHGIRKDNNHTLRSIGIRVSTGASNLENMSFGAYAFWDEDGQHILRHPNVNCNSGGKICMGSLEGSTLLGKIHISDIITLMEGVNMTSAYNDNRKFWTNDGNEWRFRDCDDMYLNTAMFKPHQYLG